MKRKLWKFGMSKVDKQELLKVNMKMKVGFNPKKPRKYLRYGYCFNPKSSLVLPATGALPIQKIYNNIVKEINSVSIATNAPITSNDLYTIPHMEAK